MINKTKLKTSSKIVIASINSWDFIYGKDSVYLISKTGILIPVDSIYELKLIWLNWSSPLYISRINRYVSIKNQLVETETYQTYLNYWDMWLNLIASTRTRC